MNKEPARPIATSAAGASMEQASTTEMPSNRSGPDNEEERVDASAEAERLGDFA